MSGTAPTAEFDAQTLPWVDRDSFPAEAERRQGRGQLTAEAREKLDSWRRDGYLYLPGLVSERDIDSLLGEYEEAWQSRPPIQVLVEGEGSQLFADVAPRETLTHNHFRLLDFHEASGAARNLMFHREIIGHLKLIFDDTPVAMQSLFFEYGSEQATHQDFPYVQAKILSHLVGCWIALEDVGPDNGPLAYYPGSHRVAKYDWGGGSLIWGGQDLDEVPAFEKYLGTACEEAGYEKLTFHAKKGDVFLWHAALVHAGSPVNDSALSRKSLVVHYSSHTGYPRDRRWPLADPKIDEHNGGYLYRQPEVPLMTRVKNRVKKLVGR